MTERASSPDVHHSAQLAIKMAIFALAALSGMVAGVLVTASPFWPNSASAKAPYSVRVPLPEARLIAPSLDVLRTTGTSENSDNNLMERPEGPSDSGISSRFDEAFRLDDAPPAPPLATGPGGMIALDYDLAQFASANRSAGSAEGSVETDLPMTVNGVESGTAQIRIADSAQILIATSSLASALGDRQAQLPGRLTTALESGTGYLPFYELRAAGIDVRYDPLNDRIALTLPS